MALPAFNMRQLLEAGVHFGHQSHRWNPKMAPFIYGARNNIHIVDLTQTVPMLHQALVKVSDTVAGGGRVLFVATKRQASEAIADAAKRSAQYFMNHRWLGGTLTNWKTVSQSIRRLRQLDDVLADPQGRTKKEILNIQRERDKLNQALGGIKDMGGTPDLLFVIDTNKEGIAIQEARKLGIPIVAVVDTNCDPDGIDFPVPGNDDAGRAITLYCDLVARAAIDGLERSQQAAGVDIGAAEAPPAEAVPEEAAKPRSRASSAREADDLKRITGISPKLEQRLNDAGVFHFWQLADLDADRGGPRPPVAAQGPSPERGLGRPGQEARRGRRRLTPARGSRARAMLARSTGPAASPRGAANHEPTMTTISASLVKELRDRTGAGMMDCKTALSETGGDVEAAIDWLRKKGLSKAAKKAGRVAAEGLVGSPPAARAGHRRGQLGDRLRRPQRAVPGHGEKIAAPRGRGEGRRRAPARDLPGKSHTVEDHVREMVATIGENMAVRARRRSRSGSGVVASYVHNQVAPGLGKIGVLVALESAGKNADELATFGRMVAMHVAAANPIALDLAGVPAEVLEREKGILAEEPGQAPAGAREDPAVEPEDLRQGELPARAAVHPRQRQVGGAGREEAEGKVGGPIKIGVRALRARRGHRAQGRRLCRRGRRGRRHRRAVVVRLVRPPLSSSGSSRGSSSRGLRSSRMAGWSGQARP